MSPPRPSTPRPRTQSLSQQRHYAAASTSPRSNGGASSASGIVRPVRHLVRNDILGVPFASSDGLVLGSSLPHWTYDYFNQLISSDDGAGDVSDEDNDAIAAIAAAGGGYHGDTEADYLAAAERAEVAAVAEMEGVQAAANRAAANLRRHNNNNNNNNNTTTVNTNNVVAMDDGGGDDDMGEEVVEEEVDEEEEEDGDEEDDDDDDAEADDGESLLVVDPNQPGPSQPAGQMPVVPAVLSTIMSDALNATNGQATAESVESLRQIVQRYEQTFKQFRQETETAIATFRQQFSDIRRKFEALKRIRVSLVMDLVQPRSGAAANNAGAPLASVHVSATSGGGAGGGGGGSGIVVGGAAARALQVAGPPLRVTGRLPRGVGNPANEVRRKRWGKKSTVRRSPLLPPHHRFM